MEEILYPIDDPFQMASYRTSATRQKRGRRGENCLRFLFNNCFLNGLFGVAHLIGYTQFMVFIVIRVIVLGSIAGRLFLHDMDKLNCSALNYTRSYSVNHNSSNDPTNITGLNGTIAGSKRDESILDIKSTCLRIVYNGNMSPLYAWIASTFPTIIPWLLLFLWTPYLPAQDNVECSKFRWPCLTLSMSTFLKAVIRFILETSFFILVTVYYKLFVPDHITCYNNTMTCDVWESLEKTCFLWLLSATSMASIILTSWEIAHVCNNKQGYDPDIPEPYTMNEFGNGRARTSGESLIRGRGGRLSSSVSIQPSNHDEDEISNRHKRTPEQRFRLIETIADEDEDVFYE